MKTKQNKTFFLTHCYLRQYFLKFMLNYYMSRNISTIFKLANSWINSKWLLNEAIDITVHLKVEDMMKFCMQNSYQKELNFQSKMTTCYKYTILNKIIFNFSSILSSYLENIHKQYISIIIMIGCILIL